MSVQPMILLGERLIAVCFLGVSMSLDIVAWKLRAKSSIVYKFNWNINTIVHCLLLRKPMLVSDTASFVNISGILRGYNYTTPLNPRKEGRVTLHCSGNHSHI